MTVSVQRQRPPVVGAPVPGALLDGLAGSEGRGDRLVHRHLRPARAAVTAPWPGWADARVVTAWTDRGVTWPWAHQVAPAEAAWWGRHVVLATGTASGKSLAYQLPALSAALAGRGDRGRRGRRDATTLYLAPTKALAHDQLASLRSLGTGVRVSTCDGDSSHDERDWTRTHAEYVLTNPDMLHHSVLPAHERWAPFLGSLRFVVVDECHHYRGVFGAHVAQVLRRLRRVCRHYGADPGFVLTSATAAEPALTASRLTGLSVDDVEAVLDDASPRGELTLGLWEPPATGFGASGAPTRRPATVEAADLMADLVAAGAATLTFARSRVGVEQVALGAAERVGEVDPALARRIAAYRGGYLPEERRALEASLRNGELRGLAATSALELGIDVAGLDAVVVAGYPGSRAALWQQLGRAGRDGGDALGVMITHDDPLDRYLVHHPEVLLGRPVEAQVIDPDNPHVLAGQLCAAAQELPLTDDDLPGFGPAAAGVVERLVADGRLRRRPRGWFWTDRRRAADLCDLRSGPTRPVTLMESHTGRVVGVVDGDRAHRVAHPGAMYLHRGEPWLVDSLDLDDHVACLSPTDPGWSTSVRETTRVCVSEERETRAGGGGTVHLGEVDVVEQVTSYLRRRQPGGEVVGEYPLDLPARELRTTAVWFTVDDAVVARSVAAAEHEAAAHAAEHALRAMLPLVATCDRGDVGSTSTDRHPDTDRLTVVVHDARAGGAGFADRGFRAADRWVRAALDAVSACPCEHGCPGCIHAPGCSRGNTPLSKDGAVAVLGALVDAVATD